MSNGGWGCPHEIDGHCGKVNRLPCDPGMKGCVLAGRYTFFSEDKNARRRQKAAPAAPPRSGRPGDDAAGGG